MKNKAIHVVGNKFCAISNGANIISYSELIEKTINNELLQYDIFFEQGISEDIVAEYKKLFCQPVDKKIASIYSYFDEDSRCDNKLTHKHFSYNTLISDPKKISDEKYSSILIIDERCAEMSDHVTGKHIQGMVLMEAARQMTIATLEKYFIKGSQNHAVKFVMNEFQSKFYNYAFPMGLVLCLKIISNSGMTNNNRAFTISIEIYQNEKKIAEIFRKVSVYDSKFIKYKENSALQDYIKSCIKTENNLRTFESVYEKAA